ncbi:hypothetical protein BV20DRAFT_1049372 [Pilatotrama ljubarskyi]|nr:hypothetical protein BV20DRAFT_1049372 [Pilatotrama ljubarskyi]
MTTSFDIPVDMLGVDQIIDATASERMLTPVAVASQVALMLGASKVSKPILKQVKGASNESENFFLTCVLLLYLDETKLVDEIGLDAVIYLRFLRMCRRLFTAVAILTCVVLLPFNITFNIAHVNPQARDVLSMLTIRDVEYSDWIFAHIAVTYAITFLVIAFLADHLQEVDSLVESSQERRKGPALSNARTFMVTSIPVERQSDGGLHSLLNPPAGEESTGWIEKEAKATLGVCIGRRMDRLVNLLDEYDNTVRDDGEADGDAPAERHGLGKRKRRLILGEVKTFLGTMQYRDPEDYGFAWVVPDHDHVTTTPMHEIEILRRLKKEASTSGAVLTSAPKNRHDVIWNELRMRSSSVILWKQIIGWIWLILVCCFYTVPLLIISALANLTSLTAYVPFLHSWSEASPASFTFVSGVIPPSISAAFGWVLPIVMHAIVEYMGAYTYSYRDRAVTAHYYDFLVISKLIIFTLIGVGFKLFKQLAKNLLIEQPDMATTGIIQIISELPAIVNRAYVDQSSYWLTFYPLSGALVLFDLTQIFPLATSLMKTCISGATRRRAEWEQTRYFPYATQYSLMLFLSTVGLFFAPLAPLVPVAAAVVFWISSGAHKYQLLSVLATEHQSDGRSWSVVVNCLLLGVFLMQAIMMLATGLSCGLKSYNWLCMAPPMFFILAFKSCEDEVRKLGRMSECPSSEAGDVASEGVARKETSDDHFLKQFRHPALDRGFLTVSGQNTETRSDGELSHGGIQQISGVEDIDAITPQERDPPTTAEALASDDDSHAESTGTRISQNPAPEPGGTEEDIPDQSPQTAVTEAGVDDASPQMNGVSENVMSILLTLCCFAR